MKLFDWPSRLRNNRKLIPANNEAESASSIHEPPKVDPAEFYYNFYAPAKTLKDESEYWISHLDLFPPKPPPEQSRYMGDDPKTGRPIFMSYSTCQIGSQFSNIYPISLHAALMLNEGKDFEYTVMKDGAKIIKVTDLMRRNYKLKTDTNQTRLLF